MTLFSSCYLNIILLIFSTRSFPWLTTDPKHLMFFRRLHPVAQIMTRIQLFAYAESLDGLHLHVLPLLTPRCNDDAKVNEFI